VINCWFGFQGAHVSDSAVMVGPIIPRADGVTVLDLFEREVLRVPGHTAVVHAHTHTTYSEVDRSAAAVGSALAAAGVQPGRLVPIVMRTGPFVPAAMLGVMKAGAAFVPLDPLSPPSRLEGDLDTIGCSLVLTDMSPPPDDGRVWLDITEIGASSDAAPQPRRPTATDPIYGFFTSGSTGRPRCALNIHRGLVNRFLAMTEMFADDGEVVLQNSAQVFDSSIWQLLWPLTRGRRVVLPARSSVLDLDATVRVIEKEGATITDFVPSVFEMLVERMENDPESSGRLNSLRRILIGGESARASTLQRFWRLLPSVRITNTYGPTEASIGSVFHEISGNDVAADLIPIGRPIANTAVVVADGDGKMARRGQIGELLIGGVCVGGGYHANPQATAAAFVDNPYHDVPGDRLYRTGDYGYVRADGMLMYSGRRDDQIKIYGARIDLGEVEAAFAEVPGVQKVKAIVTTEDDARSVTCFVVAPTIDDVEKILDEVRKLLPARSVPARVLRIGRLPLLPSGKVDRVALEKAVTGRYERDPRVPGMDHDDLVSELRRLWRQFLPDRASDEDFFASGGDSLIALRLTSAIEARFGIRFTIRDLIAAPTPSAQALSLLGKRPAAGSDRSQLADQLRRDVATLRPQSPARRRHKGTRPKSILVTGATGFIGRHLVSALLESGDRRIVCLVRARNDREAQLRLDSALATFPGAMTGDGPTAKAIAGDLSQPNLGLSERGFQDLAEDTTLIVHAGGTVNMVLDYESHRPANVAGTSEILRLASTGHRKAVCHLSTLGVLHTRRPRSAMDADIWPDAQHPPMTDGYTQSKWVAEHLVRSARCLGVPALVWRFGEVGPHTTTGAFNPRSLVTALLRLCTHFDVHLETRATIDWTPVDSAARLIARVVDDDDIPTGTLHAVRPTRVAVSDLTRLLVHTRGGSRRSVKYEELVALAQSAAVSDDIVARHLAAISCAADRSSPDPTETLFTESSADFSHPEASRLAEDSGIAWGGLEQREMTPYLHALSELCTPRCAAPPIHHYQQA
jgi:amino acid adenylation domain-containing protein/thioester reductase-like protein